MLISALFSTLVVQVSPVTGSSSLPSLQETSRYEVFTPRQVAQFRGNERLIQTRASLSSRKDEDTYLMQIQGVTVEVYLGGPKPDLNLPLNQPIELRGLLERYPDELEMTLSAYRVPGEEWVSLGRRSSRTVPGSATQDPREVEPSNRTALRTTLSQILRQPRYDQLVSFEARVARMIEPNEYLLTSDSQSVILDCGPEWHRSIQLPIGGKVRILGEVGIERAGVEIDLWEATLASGEIIRLRGEGPSPWAGRRD